MGYSKRYLLKFAFYRFQWMISSLMWPWFLVKEKCFPSNEARILTYHCISKFPQEKEIPYDNVDPHLFDAHMKVLKQESFNVIGLVELVQMLKTCQNIPPKSVVITFDDGYRNNYLNALPTLKKFGYKATFFIIAGGIGIEKPFQHLLWDKAAGNHFRANPESRLPMNVAELQHLKKCGHEIGSHGLSHRSIGNLSLKEGVREVVRSKEILAEVIGGHVSFFSYPFGSRKYNDFSRITTSILRNSGYEAACTSDIGAVSHRNNPYELPRIPVRENDRPFRFRQKLYGAFDWVNPFKNAFQKMAPRIDKAI